MKLIQKTLAGLAFAGLVMAQPIAAQAAGAQALPVRSSSPSDASEDLHGRGANVFVILGVFAGLLLLAEVTGLIDVFGNDDELPTSP